MKRRTTELFLLIAAAPPIFLLYAMFVLNTGVDLTVETLIVPIGLTIAFLIAHFAVRFLAPNADPAILPIVFVLSGIGITFVTRLAPDLATRQLAWLFLSIFAMVATLFFVRRLSSLSEYKYTIVVVGIILLLLPIFFGVERGGSKIWLSFFGLFSFQPGEIAKICIVLFLAFYLAEHREMFSYPAHNFLGIKLPPFRMFIPLLIMWLLSLIIVVFSRDLGSAVLFYGLFLIMLYTATGRWSYVFLGIILLVIGGIGAYTFFSHVQVRFDIWQDPFADPTGKGMQIVQSLFSLADGGFFGAGIGRGMPTKIPVVESDFIFSAIGEELGLLGGSAVILLYMLFIVRGFATAARANSDAAAFTAVGLTSAISLQAFLIIGGVTKLIPLTGVTLPFMSQGGSSLLASFIIVALLLRCGDEGTGHNVEMSGEGTSDKDHNLARRLGLDTPESGILGRVALSKRLVVLVSAFTIIFAILIANLTWIQVFKAEEIQAMPNNNHTIAKSHYVERGSILTSDGVILAESNKQEDGTYLRSYPQGSLAAHVVGYMSERYGSSGIESSQNDTLTGRKDYSDWQSTLNSLAGVSQPGNDVELTLDYNTQVAAEEALRGHNGAAVVLDVKTGAVLAMASSPTFDQKDIAELVSENSQSSSLVNRATQTLYAPGSTYKVVTLAAALDSGMLSLDSTYSSPGEMEIGNAPVTNSNDASHGTITVKRAFEVSSNTVFGQIASEMGPDVLIDYSRNFGVGTALGKNFSTAQSLMPKPEEMTEWETAWAGCGQPVGEHDSPPGPQITVMQAAVIAAAIANEGTVNNPYLVSKITSPEGELIYQSSSQAIGKAVSSNTAELVKESMRAVVTSGTGRAASVSGLEVSGKTGTAQISDNKSNTWFIGFAPYDNPTVAVAIILEDYEDVSAASRSGNVFKVATQEINAEE